MSHMISFYMDAIIIVIYMCMEADKILGQSVFCFVLFQTKYSHRTTSGGNSIGWFSQIITSYFFGVVDLFPISTSISFVDCWFFTFVSSSSTTTTLLSSIDSFVLPLFYGDWIRKKKFDDKDEKKQDTKNNNNNFKLN